MTTGDPLELLRRYNTEGKLGLVRIKDTRVEFEGGKHAFDRKTKSAYRSVSPSKALPRAEGWEGKKKRGNVMEALDPNHPRCLGFTFVFFLYQLPVQGLY